MHRSEWARIVATLIRLTGDWALAEDATQEAFAAAFTRWPRDVVPDRPGAWLTTTARNRVIDRLRAARSEELKFRELSWEPDATEAEAQHIDDDRLRLIFTCCHPALPLATRVALTLRTVAASRWPSSGGRSSCPRQRWRSALRGPVARSTMPASHIGSHLQSCWRSD